MSSRGWWEEIVISSWIIEDFCAELAGRPYELVAVAGGWQHRTRKIFGDAIRAAFGTAAGEGAKELSQAGRWF
ncbi:MULTISPECIES: hypothetical protein [Mesorhizobium]|uniref:hypothetical protein n=1 Tax=Mesorhizobium TaxID=68287 RepID=UPI002696753C